MFKKLLVLLQYILPQHLISILFGKIADSKIIWIKTYFINSFIRNYKINTQDDLIEDTSSYPSFNDFFIRQLKPNARPICDDNEAIISPVDGTIAALGTLSQHALLAAKQQYFDLKNLLADETWATTFQDGHFTSFYLAPYNYHRVHMPIAGRLIQSIYVPGRLFSVNRMTTEIIPHLYSRNERIVTLFETEAGPIALILIGALIVGSIQMSWMPAPIRNYTIFSESYDSIAFKKGQELGLFKLGSTVIMLSKKNQLSWLPDMIPPIKVKFGQIVAKK